MDVLALIAKMYEAAYKAGDKKVCEKIIEAVKKHGVSIQTDKLDVLNKLKK